MWLQRAERVNEGKVCMFKVKLDKWNLYIWTFLQQHDQCLCTEMGDECKTHTRPCTLHVTGRRCCFYSVFTGVNKCSCMCCNKLNKTLCSSTERLHALNISNEFMSAKLFFKNKTLMNNIQRWKLCLKPL